MDQRALIKYLHIGNIHRKSFQAFECISQPRHRTPSQHIADHQFFAEPGTRLRRMTLDPSSSSKSNRAK
ncbi:predicted protein [Plenodomus lingam JN3]|uniref:Uncharacterized protein n=1 Tax=Leptosphaeria maculans (strain JN3 / isolate v23.1.3 / race Av1-4-5-6-7-8) TaxID=985895 RepID=E4ZGM2_LEPMJ|nr:predicted protein [Plenodomus lingam JN3]CBX90442.1 predicted protein [Plenodomus lingam JN3]